MCEAKVFRGIFEKNAQRRRLYTSSRANEGPLEIVHAVNMTVMIAAQGKTLRQCPCLLRTDSSKPSSNSFQYQLNCGRACSRGEGVSNETLPRPTAEMPYPTSSSLDPEALC